MVYIINKLEILVLRARQVLSSWFLNNPKQTVVSASSSSSCMTKIPEFGTSGGTKESMEGTYWYIE